MRNLIFILLLTVLIGGCATIPPKPPAVEPPTGLKESPPLVLVTGADRPSFQDDMDVESLVTAVRQSIEYYNRLPERSVYRIGAERYIVREMKESLQEFLDAAGTVGDPSELAEIAGERFDVYRASGSEPSGRVIFTGYYEPVLKGSLEKSDRYRYPIYGKPDDAVVVHLGKFREKYRNERLVGRVEGGELVPYFSR
jgi:membrane-bound lytic murein transglycosylase A